LVLVVFFAFASFFVSFLVAGFVSAVDSVFACVFARLESSSERSAEGDSSRAALNSPPPSVFAPPSTSAWMNESLLFSLYA